MNPKVVLTWLAFLYIGCGLVWAQTPSETSPRVSSDCSQLAKRPEFLPLVKTCEFARTYRRSLPNFICEQSVENSGLPGSEKPVVIHARVKYEDGEDTYSDVEVNGKPAAQGEQITRLSMATQGEFGSQFINLFRDPAVADFSLGTAQGSNAIVYYFKIPETRNWFWAIRDTKEILHPLYQGELYIDPVTGLPLRMIGRWTDLPESFQLKSASIDTTFEEVPISELGKFLLPVHSEAIACPRPIIVSPRKHKVVELPCVRNVTQFESCRKFASKSRIIAGPPQQ